MGGGADHLFERHAGVAEQRVALGGVVEQRGGGFDAGEDRGAVEQFAEAHRQHADRDGFGAGEVEFGAGAGGEVEGAEGDGVGVALPEEVDVAHGDFDRFAGVDFLGDFEQDAVAQIAGVVEPDHHDRGFLGARKMFKNAFAAEAAHGVFADRVGNVGLARTAQRDGGERVDVAGGESGDARFVVAFGDQRGQIGVHGPGHGFFAGGTEFSAGHVDDVGRVGEIFPTGFVEQIAGDGFDAGVVEFALEFLFGEARNPDDFAFDPCFVHAAAGELGEGRAHLAADAQEDDVAVEFFHEGDEFGGGAGQEFFELLLRFDVSRQQAVRRRFRTHGCLLNGGAWGANSEWEVYHETMNSKCSSAEAKTSSDGGKPAVGRRCAAEFGWFAARGWSTMSCGGGQA